MILRLSPGECTLFPSVLLIFEGECGAVSCRNVRIWGSAAELAELAKVSVAISFEECYILHPKLYRLFRAVPRIFDSVLADTEEVIKCYQC